MQHILGVQLHSAALRGGVSVGQPAAGIPVHLHAIRQQRVQAQDAGLAAADDLAVGVAPQEQMAEHGFPPDKAGHLGVRLVMEQAVQRMFHGLLAAFLRRFIHAQRQAGDGFSDHAHAGVDRGHLNRIFRVDRLAGGGRAEVEGRRSRYSVAGLVPGAEQAEERIFHTRLRYHRPLPVFRSWQHLQRGCQLLSSQNSFLSPRCGMI